MASQAPNPDSHSGLHQAPALALKQALCFSCWDVSSPLRRCSACKRVAYCSAKCQKQDWNRNHKEICKKLVALNKQKGYVPPAGRRWDDYYEEEYQDFLSSDSLNPCELGRLIGHEPYCYGCYRRDSQLEDGAKLNACQHCRLTFFCRSCPQIHPSAECAVLQEVAADEKVKLDRSRLGKGTITYSTKLPRKQHLPLSSAKDWYDYYTNLSDFGGYSSKMNRELKCLSNDPKERKFVEYLRCRTNETTIQLTLLAALETAIPSLNTRRSLNLHILAAGGPNISRLPAFEELLHLLPSLTALHLSFVGPKVVSAAQNATATQNQHTIPCCNECIKLGRMISITTWRGPYHAYTAAESYKTPDLAAAFHAGFSVGEQAAWRPTIEYLARAPHPTLFTAVGDSEIRGEMEVWRKLGVEFVKEAEVNKWKGMSPSLVVCGERPNEVTYQNYWWYIVKQR